MSAVTTRTGTTIQGSSPRSSWAFMTNHTQVLLCIARDPSVRLRDVATTVGITERAAQSIVADLVGEQYLSRTRIGRRNQYQVHLGAPLRHHDNGSLTIGGLLDFLLSDACATPYSRISLQPDGLAV